MTFPETETHYFSVMGPIPHGIQDIISWNSICLISSIFSVLQFSYTFTQSISLITSLTMRGQGL